VGELLDIVGGLLVASDEADERRGGECRRVSLELDSIDQALASGL
jgi:hypothetical protein